MEVISIPGLGIHLIRTDETALVIRGYTFAVDTIMQALMAGEYSIRIESSNRDEIEAYLIRQVTEYKEHTSTESKEDNGHGYRT
jgi:hypothetical protein